MKTKELIKLRIRELIFLCQFVLAWIIARFKEKDIWLISERGKEARDNAYFFFVWLKEHHPEIKAKYIVSKDSNDYHKLDQWPQDRVEYDSMKHLISIWQAKYFISAHLDGCICNCFFLYKIDRIYNIFHHKKRVFLQHGITKDFIRGFIYKRHRIDLFITGSKIEYEYIKNNFGYPEGIVKYTGFCRYDNLNEFRIKKQLLIMPTWRTYIDLNHFEESTYYLAYKDLLCSKELHALLNKYGYQAIFYPHYMFQSKIHLFKELDLPDSVVIADMRYDVQTLLKESEVLLTDFSSVFFDMMYMHKPILFYQFDEEEYRARHYQEGYLHYRDVGPVVQTLPEVIAQLEAILANPNSLEKYVAYYDQTFALRDNNNCQRVFDAIMLC